jgi:hypothetical protein
MKTVRPVLVIKTKDLEKTRLLYEALGLSLMAELHEGCPLHYSCDFGGLLIEFYPNGKKSDPVKVGNDQLLIFEVEHFDLFQEICRSLDLEQGPITVHGEPAFRAVTIRDVDGRRIRVREIDDKAPH